jgi:hypothetical protein
MAFNILGLMHLLLFSITQVEPIWADLIGGMDRLPDLADITTRIRTKLNKKAELRRAIARNNSADESSPLQAGASLIFRIQSQVSFKDRTAYRNVSVSGDIFVKNQLKVLVKVGSVDFQQDDSQCNPVLAYLQRHGTALGLTTPLANEGYTLTNPDVSTALLAPLTNEPYSRISTPFTSTPTSLTSLRFRPLSPMVCGRVLQLADMLRLWSQRATQIASLRMFFFI